MMAKTRRSRPIAMLVLPTESPVSVLRNLATALRASLGKLVRASPLHSATDSLP